MAMTGQGDHFGHFYDREDNQQSQYAELSQLRKMLVCSESSSQGQTPKGLNGAVCQKGGEMKISGIHTRGHHDNLDFVR